MPYLPDGSWIDDEQYAEMIARTGGTGIPTSGTVLGTNYNFMPTTSGGGALNLGWDQTPGFGAAINFDPSAGIENAFISDYDVSGQGMANIGTGLSDSRLGLTAGLQGTGLNRPNAYMDATISDVVPGLTVGAGTDTTPFASYFGDESSKIPGLGITKTSGGPTDVSYATEVVPGVDFNIGTAGGGNVGVKASGAWEDIGKTFRQLFSPISQAGADASVPEIAVAPSMSGVDYSKALADVGMATVPTVTRTSLPGGTVQQRSSGMAGGGPGDIISENLGTGHPGAGVGYDHGVIGGVEMEKHFPGPIEYNMPNIDMSDFPSNMPTGPKEKTTIDKFKEWWDAPLEDKLKNLYFDVPIVPPVIASTDVPGPTQKEINAIIAKASTAPKGALERTIEKSQPAQPAGPSAAERKAQSDAQRKKAMADKKAAADAQKEFNRLAAKATQEAAAARKSAAAQADKAKSDLRNFLSSRAYQEEGEPVPAHLIDLATQVDTFAGYGGPMSAAEINVAGGMEFGGAGGMAGSGRGGGGRGGPGGRGR